MLIKKPHTAIIGLILILWQAQAVHAEHVRIAVASNFAPTLQKVIEAYTKHNSSIRFSLSPASTGKHYAQIRLGAPFDAFFAADQDRPQKLLDQGIGDKRSFTLYAKGRLALWSKQSHPIFEQLNTQISAPSALSTLQFKHLAIADPKLAPYGSAAEFALTKLSIHDKWSHKLVMGENISQAFNMVYSGAAQFGLVAYSQVLLQNQKNVQGHSKEESPYWLLPQELHPEIAQAAIVLRSSPNIDGFFQYLTSETAQAIIQAAGYDITAASQTESNDK